jgi:hypothetical protein
MAEITNTTSTAPTEFTIGGRQRIVRAPDDKYDSYDLDPRGIIWLFEPPRPNAKYIVGVDATQGRSGWSRYARAENDESTDNGAVVVLRLGRGEPGSPHFAPDKQVAEYAAPIDPYDLAAVVNALGRLYAGRDEDGQAHCIIEVYPGPGGPCQRTLMEKYGYTNLYRFQYLDTGEHTSKQFDFGWYSNKQSMQHLWTRGLRFIHKKQVVLKSPWLVEELADCEMDLVKLRGAAASGGHDDRVTALLLAVWAGHGWSFDVTPDTTSKVEAGPRVEWQATDITSDRIQELYDQRWEEISREVEQEFG